MADELFNRYDGIIKKANQNPQLNSTLYTAADTNPDEEAGLHKLSQKVGLPVEALRVDKGEEARRLAVLRGRENLQTEAPATASFLSSQENAKVSHDDVDNLTAAEKALTFLGDYIRNDIPAIATTYGASIGGGFEESFGGLMQYLAEDEPVVTLYGEEHDRKANEAMARYAKKGADISAEGRMVSAEVLKAKPTKTWAGGIVRNAVQSIGAMAPGIVGGIATGNPAVPILTMGAQTFGEGYGEGRARGLTEGDATTKGSIQGATEMLTEIAPFVALTKFFKPGSFMTKMAGYYLAEFPGEAVATAVQNTTDKYFDDPNTTPEERKQKAIDYFFSSQHTQDQVDTFFTTLVQGLILSGTAKGVHAIGGKNDATKKLTEAAARTGASSKTLEALGEVSTNSKLRERLPEKFQEFIAKAKGETESVFIPADRWATFWQEQGIDPKEKIQEVMGDSTSFQEALASGGDVVIPLEAFATHIAPTEFHKELSRDVRLHSGDMTQRELDEWGDRTPEEFDSVYGEVTKPEDTKVFDDVMGQLLGTGRERGTAEKEATLLQSVFRTLGERTGQDAFSLYEKYKLKISRPLPSVLANRLNIDTSIDPLLEALRAGKIPSEAEAFGPSLLEFLRETGVEDQGGELSALGIDETIKPFQKKIVRKYGLPLDRARGLAAEAGYLSEESSIKDFLDAIDKELRGKPVYSPQAEKQDLVDSRLSLNQFKDYLESRGVDVATMSNEEIKKLLSGQLNLYQDSAPVAVRLFERFEGMNNKERLQELYIDKNTGTLNKRAFNLLPPKKYVAHISIEGTKWVNDNHSHEDGNKLYKMAGQALLNATEGVAKIGGDFAFYVDNREELDAVLSKANENLSGISITDKTGQLRHFEAGSFRLTGEIGENLKEAGSNHGEWKKNAEESGARAKRGAAPLNLKESSEAADKKPEKIHPIGEELTNHYKQQSSEDQLFDLYIEKNTGLLTEDGFNAVRSNPETRKKHIITFDLNGLKIINAHLNEGNGDILLEAFGRAIAAQGGAQFDFAHKSGDEYYGQGDDADALQAFAEAVYKISEESKLDFVLDDGTLIRKNGLTFGYGIGETYETADARLSEHKKQLTALGIRGDEAELKRLERLAENGETRESADRERGSNREVTQGTEVPNPFQKSSSISSFINTALNDLGAATVTELYQDTDGKRAAIRISPNREMEISLFEKADLSSFLHESGHFFFEVLSDLASEPDAPQQVKDDFASLLKWFGVTDKSEVTTSHHERFARGFVAYLMEGKSPSSELSAYFQRFKAWLTRIYKDLKNLNVELTDEVKGVFDRLVATDDEIKRAQELQKFTPLFVDAQTAGMTEREFQAYKKEAERAHKEASDYLEQKLIKELTRENEAWWKEESQKVRAEVEEEVKSEPSYQAFQVLTKGVDFEGNKAPEGFKISRQDLARMYGEDFVKKLPRSFRYVYSKEGGLHPDEVAEVFGFSSGDELIRTMVNAPPMKAYVEAETMRRMRSTHRDMLNDGSLTDEALKAVHSDSQGQVLRAELKALRRKQREVSPFVKAAKAEGDEALRREKQEREYERRWLEAEKKLTLEIERGAKEEELKSLREEIKANKEKARLARKEMEAGIPPTQAFKTWAAQAIGSKAIKSVNPNLYLKAEQKAGRLAFELASKGNFQKAGEEKQKQLLNHYLYLEAVKAKEEAEKVYSFMQKMEKPRAQGILGKAGEEYQKAINALLDQYEFRRVTNKELNYRASLDDLIKRLKADGRDTTILETTQTSLKTNYRELTIDELRGIHDLAKFTYHMAKTAHDFMLGEEKFAKELIRGEVVNSITSNAKKVQVSMANDSGFKAIGKGIKDFISNSYTADTVLFGLDGWERLGPVYRNIKGVIDDAVSKNLLPMQAKAAEDLEKIYSVYSHKELRSLHRDRFFIPELNGSFTKEEILEIASHQGNEGNKEALVNSRLAQRLGLTQDKINAVLDRFMDARDWDFVQAKWDYLETYWSQIAEKQRQRKGIVPSRVEPSRVVNRHGDYRGGYYPLKYDAGKSVNAAQDSAEEFFTSVRQGRFSWAQTAHGHTVERVGSGGRAVLLSPSIFYSHINQVITDLALGDAVNFSASVLNDAVVKSAFEDAGAVDARKYLDVWLTDTAMGEKVGADILSRTFRYLRTGIAAKSMLFNVGVAALQISGLFQTAGTIGAGNTVYGIKTLLSKPWRGKNSVGWQIAGMSPFMAKREETFQKDMMDLINSFKQSRTRNFISEYGMLLIKKGQHIVDMASWLGAYHEAQADNKTEEEAIAYADRMVARSQGSGLFSDRSAIERGSLGQDVRQNELVRAMTTLLSYQIAKFNVAVEKVGRTDFHKPQQVIALAGDMVLLYIMDTAATLLLTGVWPGGDDDDESWAWKLTKKTASSMVSAIPGARDVTSVFEGFASGGTLGTFGDALKRVYVQSEQGEADLALFKSVDNLGGLLLRYPSSAINRFVDASVRDLDGEDVALIEYFVYQDKGGHK